tara:strand:- start:32492 stop:33103 length:612 start_codon:yes stop_codon:yes gene_type:complete
MKVRKDMSDAGFIRSLQEFYKERGFLSRKQQEALLALAPEEFSRWETAEAKKNPFEETNTTVSGDYKMQMTDTVLSENPDFKIVNIVFAPYTSTKSYSYKTLMTDLEVGDKVAVWVKNQELKIVEVVSIMDPLEVDLDPNIRYAWVVQKIDTAHFDECLAMENKLMEKLRIATVRKRRAELREDVMNNLTEEERTEATKLVRL